MSAVRILARSLATKSSSPTAAATRALPEPKGKVTDVASFLAQIGRKSGDLADKFKSWEHLFTARSRELRELGLTPQQRKYVLFWTEKYRQGVQPRHVKSTR
ncbi:hypothetical protein RI367_001735 [Sorochytrium milnesiophthora]